MIDLEPATSMLTSVVRRVRDDQLGLPTPCADTSIGGLLAHVDGLSLAFAAAATKTPLPGGSQGPSADASRLGTDWRRRISERLQALAAAWHDQAAWAGMTQAGGQDLPAEVAAVVALNEVIVHGWDIAVASGQTFSCEPALVEAAYGFVRPTVAQNPGGTPGLFGPPVAVPDNENPARPASRLDRPRPRVAGEVLTCDVLTASRTLARVRGRTTVAPHSAGRVVDVGDVVHHLQGFRPA